MTGSKSEKHPKARIRLDHEIRADGHQAASRQRAEKASIRVHERRKNSTVYTKPESLGNVGLEPSSKPDRKAPLVPNSLASEVEPRRPSGHREVRPQASPRKLNRTADVVVIDDEPLSQANGLEDVVDADIDVGVLPIEENLQSGVGRDPDVDRYAVVDIREDFQVSLERRSTTAGLVADERRDLDGAGLGDGVDRQHQSEQERWKLRESDLLDLDLIEQIFVALGLLHLVEQKGHRFNGFQSRESTPQQVDSRKLVCIEEQLFATCPRA